MICGDSCLSIFVCCEKNIVEDKTSGLNRKREIVLDRQNIKIEHFPNLEKLKHIECLSTSDLGSESDSGVGSVRTASARTNKTAEETVLVEQTGSVVDQEANLEVPKSPEAQYMDRDSTICTVTRADSMATLDQDCNSLDAFDDDDILSIFTNHLGNESLSDLMMAEFKKMTTINVKQLAYDFAKHDQLLCAADKKVFDHLPLQKQLSQKHLKAKIVAESTPDVPSTPEIDLKNREKKMRKKRKMTRKTNFEMDEKEIDYTSDSSRDSPCNGRKTFQKKQ